jgi:DNA-binding NarL/FixJ family response regulator
MNAIRLMLVDDHDIIRAGLRTFLETQQGIQVVAEARDGVEAVELALLAQPDVALMDIGLPRMDGIEATRRLRELLPGCQVLALTVHDDQQSLLEMVAAGASGYLTKQTPTAELVTAIRLVAQGFACLPPQQTRWLVDEYARLVQERQITLPTRQLLTHEQDLLTSLSGRERQVLELIAMGESNPQIGARLEISPKTVARHRERIMHKLDLHSCTDLVKFAIRSGLVGVT